MCVFFSRYLQFTTQHIQLISHFGSMVAVKLGPSFSISAPIKLRSKAGHKKVTSFCLWLRFQIRSNYTWEKLVLPCDPKKRSLIPTFPRTATLRITSYVQNFIACHLIILTHFLSSTLYNFLPPPFFFVCSRVILVLYCSILTQKNKLKYLAVKD